MAWHFLLVWALFGHYNWACSRADLLGPWDHLAQRRTSLLQSVGAIIHSFTHSFTERFFVVVFSYLFIYLFLAARALGTWALELRLISCGVGGLVAPRRLGSSRTRARTCVPCIGRRILNHCTAREVPHWTFFKHVFLGQSTTILRHHIITKWIQCRLLWRNLQCDRRDKCKQKKYT